MSLRTQSDDTAPAAERVQFEIWRRMTPVQKLELWAELQIAAERLTEAGIRQRYPSASARELFLRRVSLTLDRQTMIQAYGWDPTVG